ncbi:major facilitator transporter [Citromicrobium sp. RCC1885]|uniref:MFS transporter n=1 Tax=unclassified Citromicrobium TaxID=2630544 RepID=UPI0006C9255C|nr:MULTISPECIES: MFS transporter [unclassified Citromicrobium]KPM25580.1 major facilitator transporter [Citromicrobium sp. RCC1885]KPM28822.1 major facilitator transporter [Citromicrobium sp. RCC1878]MAY77610.1 MFS transporter [Citromicrobium sp.]OAM09628.1 MFS transporter [Citromicrobium sp. RCC1897]|tara:strand:+ start:198 stop:1832 length:1635 start_codon:yes stop_codon:yes gene_type:complete
MSASAAASANREPTDKEIRLVIAASSAGTIFEWYDFFIYGTLAGLIGAAFFPSGNETLQILLVWAGFAVGFGFRPLGAILFGFLGDRLGRKYTFLVTVTLMGIATAGVGLIPDAATIGIAAPIIVIGFRILQGLALGGEYGGAAIYVAEHAPPEKRGFYTSFIQASVVGGFVLSIIVVLTCRWLIPAEDFAAWGWRVPFLLSIILLGISLWMRLKLSESPVFKAMKEAGETSGNPFIESFTYPGNKKRIFVALFGITGVLTTIWYTAFFSSLSFLRGPMRVDESVVEWMLLAGGLISMSFYLVIGRWSDKIGRKLPIILGAGLSLALLFPVFWGMGHLANPGLSAAAERTPVVVTGQNCTPDPFAELFGREQTDCGKLLDALTSSGVRYELREGGALGLSVGGEAQPLDPALFAQGPALRDGVRDALSAKGFDFSTQVPPVANILGIVGLLLVMGMLSALTYGSVAALLTEMFPPQIRYSSMSIPYHIGAGYLGGFLPLIAGIIVARSGDIYAGLWYTWIVVAFGLLVAWWGLPSGPPRDFGDA